MIRSKSKCVIEFGMWETKSIVLSIVMRALGCDGLTTSSDIITGLTLQGLLKAHTNAMCGLRGKLFTHTSYTTYSLRS